MNPDASGTYDVDTPGRGEGDMDTPFQWSAGDSPEAALALKDAVEGFEESGDADEVSSGGSGSAGTETAANLFSRPDV